MAHRPDVVGGDGIYAVENDKRFPRRIRAGDGAPIPTVPVLDQGLPDVLRRAAGVRGETYGPDIIRRDHRHRVELIPVCAGAHIRAGNDFPGPINGGRWAGSRGRKRRGRLRSCADWCESWGGGPGFPGRGTSLYGLRPRNDQHADERAIEKQHAKQGWQSLKILPFRVHLFSPEHNRIL